MASFGSSEIIPNRVAIKFLLPNGITGSLIGSGGSAIKELMEISGAKVFVSSSEDLYPGTNDRIILVTGTESSVSMAQALIWQLLAQNFRAIEAGERSETWIPRKAHQEFSVDAHDDFSVNAKITIPAAAGGLILGRGGASIRQISEESGAKISMTSKDESIFTQERILSISGPKSSCVKSLALVLSKLSEDSELAQFVNRGTSFSNSNHAPFGQGERNGSGGRGRGRGGGGGGGGGRNGRTVVDPMEGVSGSTTISLAIPEALVGNILGKNGSVIREINSLSGAKVTVSPRGDYIEGTTNRLVTITGAPECANTAHHYVTQKLQQATTPKAGRKFRESNGKSKDNDENGDDSDGDDKQ